MKGVIVTFGLLLICGISGCIGWGDYMRFPPASTSPYIWFRQNISEVKKDEEYIEKARQKVEKSRLFLQDFSKKHKNHNNNFKF